MMRKRILWVDIYKGILIFLMVLGHTLSGFTYWIYPFHMAAFFFISGYVTDYAKCDFVDFIKKKAKALMVPFLVSNLLFIGLVYLLRGIGLASYFYETAPSLSTFTNFVKYLWTPDLGGATWFLVVLFLADILGKLIYDLLKRAGFSSQKLEIRELLIASFLLISCFILFHAPKESLPYYLDLVPMALFFITCGRIFKSKTFKIELPYQAIALILALLFSVWFHHNYFHIEWVSRHFPNLILFLLASFSGIIILSFFAKGLELIGKKMHYSFRLLSFLGQNTLAILIYHFLGFRVLFVLLYAFGILSLPSLKWLTPLYHGFLSSFGTSVFAIFFAVFLYKLLKVVIRRFSKINFFKYPAINCLWIILLVFLFGKWVFHLYFSFDDWNNLVTLPYMKLRDMFIILPDSVYCSRPGGWIVVKILLLLFGKNYQAHAASMLFIHAVNAIMIYFICHKVFAKQKYKNTIGLMSALIFALYPISSFASFWEAGMFDLFGTTLMLLSILLFLKIDSLEGKKYRIKKIILSLLLIMTYYASLRTKEMFIGLPVALFIYSFFQHLEREKLKLTFQLGKLKLKAFLKKNVYLIVLMIVMFGYFILSRILNTSSTITHDINDPYYYTFQPVVLLKNLFAYIYMYFTPQSMVYGDALEIISYSNYYKISILGMLFVFAYYILQKWRKKEYLPFLIMIFFAVTILPVLPMKNMHHILYLYAPAIFIAMFLAIFVHDLLHPILKNGRILIVVTLLILGVCNIARPVQNFRDFWIRTANQDKKSYLYFVNLSKTYQDVTDIYIQNVPTDFYTSLYNGSGYIVQVAFDNPKLKVHINKEYKPRKNTLEIDFNDYDYQIISEGE